jgi:hypothetical protein
MILAWHVCCKSRGLLPDMTLAEFEQAADEAIAFIPENGDGTVDPTRPVVGPD